MHDNFKVKLGKPSIKIHYYKKTKPTLLSETPLRQKIIKFIKELCAFAFNQQKNKKIEL